MVVEHTAGTPALFPFTTLFRSRFFPEALQVEIKKKSSHDVLVERALKPDSLILADMKAGTGREVDRKSTRLNSSHPSNSYAVIYLKKKNIIEIYERHNRFCK